MPPGTSCSPDQEAQWLLYQLAPGTPAYHVLLAVRIHTRLNLGVLRRAVTAVGERHDSLRSVFREEDGQLVRVVRPAPLELSVRAAAVPRPEDLRDLVRQVYVTPFRLDEDGPARMVLLRHAPDDATLVVVTHHIAADAASQFVLLRDLVRAYRGLLTGTGPGWAPRPASLAEHHEAQQQLIASPRGARLRAYWRGQAAGSVPAQLPPDRARPALPTFNGATHDLWLTGRTGSRIAEAAGQAGVTPFAVLLAAFQALLYRYCGLPDFLIGCPVTARFAPGTRDTVGYLVNTLLLRTRFTRATTLRDAIVAAHRQVRNGIAHAAVPVVLDAGASGVAQPFRVIFTHVAMDRLDPPLALPAEGELEGPPVDYEGLRLALVDMPQQEGQSELSVKVLQCGGTYRVIFTYNTDLYQAATIARLTRSYRTLVQAALDSPGTRLAAVPLVEQAELAQMIRFGGAATCGQ